MRINLKDQLLKSEPPTELTERKTRKRKQAGNDKLNYGVPIKKVGFHDDSFVENIDFDTAPLFLDNEAQIQMFIE